MGDTSFDFAESREVNFLAESKSEKTTFSH